MKKIILGVIIFYLFTSCGTRVDHSQAMALYKETLTRVEDTTSQNARIISLYRKMQDSSLNVVFNNLQVFKYYLLFKSELQNRGVFVLDKDLGIKYYFVEEGLKNGPELAKHNRESLSNPEKKYILFSTELLGDEDKLKAAVYRELTLRMRLELTPEDSDILRTRNTSEYNYDKISERDYKRLFALIKERMQEKYFQVIVYEK